MSVPHLPYALCVAYVLKKPANDNEGVSCYYRREPRFESDGGSYFRFVKMARCILCCGYNSYEVCASLLQAAFDTADTENVMDEFLEFQETWANKYREKK